VKPRLGSEKIAKRCLFFVEMAPGRECEAKRSRPFYFPCGCDLTAECRLARANVRAQLPAAHQFLEMHIPFSLPCISISNKPRTSSCSRVSKTQLAWGSTRAACPFSMGSWQTRNALALQASSYEGGTHRLQPFHLRELEVLRAGASLVVMRNLFSITNPSVAGRGKPHMVDQLIRSGSNLPTC